MPGSLLRRRLAVVLFCAAAVPLVLLAQGPPSATADVQSQLADLLFADGRYREAADAYRRVLSAPDTALASRAGTKLVLSLLRVGDFRSAATVSADLRRSYPDDAHVAAVRGDSLWASGLFEEAEAAYEQALERDPAEARGRNGRARSLAGRSRLEEAIAEASETVRLDPREPEFRHTIGSISLRMHRYADAAAAFNDYLNLLPNKDRSDLAMWTRSQIRFLRSFDGQVPIDLGEQPPDRVWTVPVQIRGDKVMVRARVNGAWEDFVLDTGAEHTVVSRDLARRRHIGAVTVLQTAGVGDTGLRDLEIGRVETLQVGDLVVRNLPCLIKNPPLTQLPGNEPESFSPLALGLSMRLDYARRVLTMGRTLPPAEYDTTLPLRMQRLAMIRGTVNGKHPATFVVDTGGEVISISDSTAGLLQNTFRRIPLKVYGSSGWDKDAFLMPNVDLEFSSTVRFQRIPVVVLNLRAPSALLGFEVGGILGHKFLSKYRVTIDMQHSVVGLENVPSS
jgi:tetratricopeptide (TPR) repeat protein